MKRTALTIVAVLGMSLFFASQIDWTGETYALAMMTVDALAATVVLFHPAGRAQAMIGLTYLLQITVYFARLLRGEHANIDAYWWQLSILALLQLVVLGGWWIYELVDRWRAVPDDSTLAHSPYRGRVEP